MKVVLIPLAIDLDISPAKPLALLNKEVTKQDTAQGGK